jgi:hypothetical protein
VEASRTLPRSLVVLLLAALGAVLHLQAAPSYHPGHQQGHAVTVTVGAVKADTMEVGAVKVGTVKVGTVNTDAIAAVTAKAAGSRSTYGKEQVKPPAHPVVLSRSASSRLLLTSGHSPLATCARSTDPGTGSSLSASNPSHSVSLRPGAATALLQVFRC